MKTTGQQKIEEIMGVDDWKKGVRQAFEKGGKPEVASLFELAGYKNYRDSSHMALLHLNLVPRIASPFWGIARSIKKHIAKKFGLRGEVKEIEDFFRKRWEEGGNSAITEMVNIFWHNNKNKKEKTKLFCNYFASGEDLPSIFPSAARKKLPYNVIFEKKFGISREEKIRSVFQVDGVEGLKNLAHEVGSKAPSDSARNWVREFNLKIDKPIKVQPVEIASVKSKPIQGKSLQDFDIWMKKREAEREDLSISASIHGIEVSRGEEFLGVIGVEENEAHLLTSEGLKKFTKKTCRDLLNLFETMENGNGGVKLA